jgi:SAM-dependent methyltransferase
VCSVAGEPTRSPDPQTWHHGLVATWWAEFNDDFRPHEIPYFEKYIEDGGEPALDVGCGTGRLLLPYLRAGFDVDGCDVSADMVALCREKADREGFTPGLWAQPMHELDAPRKYKTIYCCGAFGLGSTREQDEEALRRFRAALEPGGTLLVDIEVPYADKRTWAYWLPQDRAALPEEPREPRERRRAGDGDEYALVSRIVDVDPLGQRLVYEMRAQQWRGDDVIADETRSVTINLYFAHELAAMIERAGFADVEVQGDHNDAPATADDDFIVFVARR